LPQLVERALFSGRDRDSHIPAERGCCTGVGVMVDLSDHRETLGRQQLAHGRQRHGLCRHATGNAWVEKTGPTWTGGHIGHAAGVDVPEVDHSDPG
jgi:hypothetical protein